MLLKRKKYNNGKINVRNYMRKRLIIMSSVFMTINVVFCNMCELIIYH